MYVRYASSNDIFVNGRTEDIAEAACSNLGLSYNVSRTFDTEKSFCRLKKHIDQQAPAIISLDFSSCLSYYGDSLAVGISEYNNDHKIFINGYDDNLQIIYLYDNYFQEEKTLSYQKLFKGWNGDAKPFAPEHWMLTIAPPEKFLSLQDTLLHAVQLNIHHYLHPFGTGMGLKGLKKFSKDIFKWPLFMSAEELKKNCYSVYSSLELIGSGGGNFRRMQARFLKFVSEQMYLSKLIPLYEEYFNIALLWREVAKMFHESSQNLHNGIFNENKIGQHQQLLENIYKTEHDLIYTLKQIFL